MLSRTRFLGNFVSGLLAAAVLTIGQQAAAQNAVVVNGGSSTGAVAVNVAAGNNNQQVNAGSIGEGVAAIAVNRVSQHSANAAANSAGSSAVIADGAFSGSAGWLAVNGASGDDNQQANLAAIGIGIEAGGMADNQLSQTRASTQPPGGPTSPAADPDRSAAIGDGAFQNSSGLIQVSLIGGDRNSSANTFALSISGSANP